MRTHLIYLKYNEFEYVIFGKLDGMFFKKTTRGKSLYFNKKDFRILGQRDFIKKFSNDNYVSIVYQRVLSPWDRTQALTYTIRAVSLP